MQCLKEAFLLLNVFVLLQEAPFYSIFATLKVGFTHGLQPRGGRLGGPHHLKYVLLTRGGGGGGGGEHT